MVEDPNGPEISVARRVASPDIIVLGSRTVFSEDFRTEYEGQDSDTLSQISAEISLEFARLGLYYDLSKMPTHFQVQQEFPFREGFEKFEFMRAVNETARAMIVAKVIMGLHISPVSDA